ncbi:MAG: hypothetical protein C5B48_13795 [Candidatus Rokuibacteriota bacterium]|nr:MAG: hypothetical protein C5B48_13795 [Candidatus Rokubacteria bacterium]
MGGLLPLRPPSARGARPAHARDHRRHLRSHATRSEQRGGDESGRAGGRRPRRGGRVRAALRSRQAATGSLRDLPRAPRPRRPRAVHAYPPTRHPRPRGVHPGDGRARDLLDRDRVGLRGGLRHHRGAPAQPADRPHAARRLARRCLDADLLDRARGALRRLLPARLVPRCRAARCGYRAASARDGALHGRCAHRGERRAVRAGGAPSASPRVGTGGLQRQPPDSIHALGRARGREQRLRAGGAGEGTARAGRRAPLHPPGGVAVGRHRSRARVRERSHRCRARGEDLLLAGSRAVRVPGGGQRRRAVDRRGEPVRRVRLHHRQLRRRRALRRHRPTDQDHVSEIAYRLRLRRRRPLIPTAWRQPLALIGAAIAVAWLVIALFAPLIAPANPLAQTFTPSQAPSLHHLFGTDELGRDVLSRVVYGARVSLPIAFLLVTMSALIGGTIGALSGYFRGVTDGALMRSTDLVFAFPPIILAMVVAAVLGRGLRNAALAIVIVSWPAYARVMRGLVLTVGESEYVQSARLLGAPARRALVRDVLPNVAGPIVVLAMLDLATAILLLSGLSFLGLGAQPPQAEWGSMVADGTQYFQWWWMGTFPGLAIFTAVLAFNFLGDSLRDVLDPKTAWRPHETQE